MSEPDFLQRPDGETVAYRVRHSTSSSDSAPSVIWLGGFKSDMTGTKATALDQWAGRTGRAFVRFDYLGHGESSGDFKTGTISRWKDDALAVMDRIATSPQILVGSSMGGWIAILMALARPDRVKGIVFVAPAPDFVEDLMWQRFTDAQRKEIMERGYLEEPSEYDDEPYVITKALIEDGRTNLVMGETIPITVPVRLLHGMKDVDVPWQRSLTLVDKLASTDVVTTFVKDADHRISDEANIARLVAMVEELCGVVDGA